MTTELTRFTQWAAEKPQRRYTALMGMLTDEWGLAESFERQPSNKAVGVDGISKADYERELGNCLADRSAPWKRMGYPPRPSRRVYIPKSNGGKRPIGIPCFEDRIVAIWEPE